MPSNQPMRVFSIGRARGVAFHIDDESVSRIHAEIIQSRSGAMYLTDCGSSGGTFLWQDSEWLEIRQAYVDKSHRVKFGEVEVDVAKLLSLTSSGSSERVVDKTPGTGNLVQRDPITGEVVVRK